MPKVSEEHLEARRRQITLAAARLVAVSESMAVRLVRKGVPPDRIDVIHNWADTDSIRETARDNDFARANGLVDTFVVQYAGNVGRSQGRVTAATIAKRIAA